MWNPLYSNTCIFLSKHGWLMSFSFECGLLLSSKVTRVFWVAQGIQQHCPISSCSHFTFSSELLFCFCMTYWPTIWFNKFGNQWSLLTPRSLVLFDASTNANLHAKNKHWESPPNSTGKSGAKETHIFKALLHPWSLRYSG